MQPQPPADDGEALPDDLLPFAGAANTESWMVFFALAHFGQVMAWVWFITMRS